MDDSDGLKDWKTYLSVDIFSEKIQIVLEDWPILRFENIADLRTYCCLLLTEANSLETHLSSLEKLRKKSKTVGKRYAKKAIKEWEEQIGDSLSDAPPEQGFQLPFEDISEDPSV